jgi:hypothetical protein
MANWALFSRRSVLGMESFQMMIKWTKVAFAAGLAAAVFGGDAYGQQAFTSSRNVAAYNYYAQPGQEAVPSPSDIEIPEDSAPPAAMAPSYAAPNYNTGYGCAGDCNGGCAGDSCCGGGCTSSCCGIDWFGDCCLGDPWELAINDNCRGIHVGGWAQVGYHTEGVNGNGTGLFNDYPNRVQLHQGYLFAERETNTGGCGWDFGFRADFVYGTDGPDTQAFGGDPDSWDNPWDYGSAYGSAIPQLYGEVAYNDLKVKFGKFYTIIGYESVMAPDNFFYSHSYSQYRAEPFTHTGALAEFAYNDYVTLYGGYTLGWDTGFTRNGGDTFLGGMSVDVTDCLNVTYALTYGDFGFEDGGDGSDNDGYSHSIVVDWIINSNWEYVFQTDYIRNDDFLNANDELFSVNQYLYYTVNDCWKFGVRAEYFDDPRFQDEAYEVTLGANYKPHANVVIRPEVRFNEFGDGVIDPDTAVQQRDTALFGVDAIFTF